MTRGAGDDPVPAGAVSAEEYKARLANRRLLDGMDIVAGAALRLQTSTETDAYPALAEDVTLRAIHNLVDFH
ncbi:MAG: hypothetical protein RBT84_14530, partial [FCB group bacterium]|nr:hypothetical protein [FCB group bacterium]